MMSDAGPAVLSTHALLVHCQRRTVRETTHAGQPLHQKQRHQVHARHAAGGWGRWGRPLRAGPACAGLQGLAVFLRLLPDESPRGNQEAVSRCNLLLEGRCDDR